MAARPAPRALTVQEWFITSGFKPDFSCCGDPGF
jgi:hypothetical protein